MVPHHLPGLSAPRTPSAARSTGSPRPRRDPRASIRPDLSQRQPPACARSRSPEHRLHHLNMSCTELGFSPSDLQTLSAVTESQNGGAGRDLWGHPAQPPAQAGSPRAGGTAPRPGGSGISPEKETPQPPVHEETPAPRMHWGKQHANLLLFFFLAFLI